MESISAVKTRPINILHLEDSLLDADLVRLKLLAGGVQTTIHRVQVREEFDSCISQNTYDLILSDYNLPNFDGLAALELARVKCPTTPFIFCTGALGEEVAIDMIRRGATDYVLKQRLDRLVPAINRAISEARERQGRLKAEAALRDSEAGHRAALEALLVREKAARADAEMAGRMKDEFLAVASHELRTPLNAILGWASLLKMSSNKSDFEEGIEVIHRNAKHQAQLIEDILDVSRMMSGRLRLNAVPLDLGPIVQRSLETVQTAADAKGVKVKMHLNEIGLVSCDAGRMEQVIWNLVSNAIKFTSRGGEVVVELSSAESKARISVADSGAGIDADFLPFVFDRFQQADASTTRRHGGLGLGLAIVRHLVELHGGTVHAFSAGRGQGAQFVVDLPIVAVNPDVYEPAVAFEMKDGSLHPGVDCPPQVSGLNVLVLDDDADARRVLQTILEKCGATVICASSVAEAMALIDDRNVFDVAVSDIGMPVEDGYMFIRQLRNREKKNGSNRMPTAALTAYTRQSDRTAVLSAGFDTFIAKPVEPKELLNAIAEITNTATE